MVPTWCHRPLTTGILKDPPSTAPDTLPKSSRPEEQPVLDQCREAADQAVDEDANGIDPTHGAVHSNERPNDSNAVWTAAHGGPNEQPSMILGPFDSSYVDPKRHTVYHYVDIYP